MSRRRLIRRVLLIMAGMPLLQLGACTPQEFFASAIANQAATDVAVLLSTSIETVLLNAFGV